MALELHMLGSRAICLSDCCVVSRFIVDNNGHQPKKASAVIYHTNVIDAGCVPPKKRG